jgi:hypothetical protein
MSATFLVSRETNLTEALGLKTSSGGPPSSLFTGKTSLTLGNDLRSAMLERKDGSKRRSKTSGMAEGTNLRPTSIAIKKIAKFTATTASVLNSFFTRDFPTGQT